MSCKSLDKIFWITLLYKKIYVTYLGGQLYPSNLDNFFLIKFIPLHEMSTMQSSVLKVLGHFLEAVFRGHF